MAALTSEEMQAMRNDGGYDGVCQRDVLKSCVPIPRDFPFLRPSRCLCVLKILEEMQSAGEETRAKMSRCAYYLSLLLKLGQQKHVSRKCE